MTAPLLLLLVLAGSSSLNIEHPDTVRVGDRFELRVRCVSSQCTGITAGTPTTGPGINFVGTSTSSSVSIVNTPGGTTTRREFTLTLGFQAVHPGEWTIGPVDLHGSGFGTHTIPVTGITVLDGTGIPSTAPPDPPPASRGRSWILAEPRADSRGRIYPGVPVFIDYYIYSSNEVSNVTYYWSGADWGVIGGIEEVPGIYWEHGGHRGVRKSRFLTITFIPAGSGPIPVPVVSAQVTYSDFFPFSAPKDYLASEPLEITVYPFPEPVPEGWDGALLDSVHLELERRGFASGQGGEQVVRLLASGPGAAYMRFCSPPSVHGEADLLPGASGEGDHLKWWDFVVEPRDTGTVVVGPDTLFWLDRKSASYRRAVVEPCTLRIDVIPRSGREIGIPSLDGGSGGRRSLTVIAAVLLGTAGLALRIGAGRRAKRSESLESSKDPEELLSSFEARVSRILTGRRRYLGYEDLVECLESRGTPTLLARRVLRYWRDLELWISGGDPGRGGLEAMREEGIRILRELEAGDSD